MNFIRAAATLLTVVLYLFGQDLYAKEKRDLDSCLNSLRATRARQELRDRQRLREGQGGHDGQQGGYAHQGNPHMDFGVGRRNIPERDVEQTRQ